MKKQTKEQRLHPCNLHTKEDEALDYEKICYAYDKTLNKRCIHCRKGKYLISLVTGTKQKIKGDKMKKQTKEQKHSEEEVINYIST